MFVGRVSTLYRYPMKSMLGDSPENDWVGARLSVGDAQLEVISPTPRCAVPALEHGPLQNAKGVLRVLAEENRQPILNAERLPSLGVYATVVRSAQLSLGDEVRLD